MSQVNNKVVYGLSNCYYAKITDTGSAITYSTPTAIKGAVNLSVSPVEEEVTFAADNDDEYFEQTINTGYEGELEVAVLSDTFRTDILGEVYDESTGTYVEDADAKRHKFALLFQIDGDVSAKRYVLYYCKCNRPKIESGTTAKKEAKTQTLSFKSRKHPYINKTKSVAVSTGTAYTDWFTSVFVPTVG